jgi:thiosulfate/3-mercaptopyruvate sulfurtransferase
MSVLISAAELAADLETPVILDVRWKLGGPPGHGEYLQGHIPGAVFVDLDTELATHGEPADGRHPLPSPDAFQAAARRWGVTLDRPVVVYDGAGNLAAARAWWLLRWAGVPDVRLLDGALPAWGGPLATDDVQPVASDVVLPGGALPTLEADDVEAFAASGVLLDARAGERYRGEVEPIDPVAGHIPGAVSAPTTENLGADGRFLGAEQLRARFASFGEGPVGVYCGSGVTAAHEIAALAIAGIDAALYAGSWSQWSNQPGRPVATGPS